MPMAHLTRATIVYYDNESWQMKPIVDLKLENLPERCYIFLPIDNYPKDVQERLPILRHFDAPPVLATKMCTEINGYFGSKSIYDENNDKLKSYSTWMRCLVKMIVEEPLANGKDYKWYEMTFLSKWDKYTGRHQFLCIDTPDYFPRKILGALKGQDHMSVTYYRDPFAMHAPLMDQVVELNDESVWAIRHPIRKIEKRRPTAGPDFEAMHEISRHTIHVSEVLLVTIQNFGRLREEQLHLHNEIMESGEITKQYREQALEYLNFQIQMLRSLRERSISNHSRLSSEITVAYNRIAQQDNRIMKSIAFLTMIFLPAAFISSFFSTTFFSYGEVGLQVSQQMWLYWVVTIPSTLITVVSWRLLLHTKTPVTFDSIQSWVKSSLEQRRKEVSKKQKQDEVQEKAPV